MLSTDDLNKIQAFILPIENRISDLERRMLERFDIVDQNFDALFKLAETNQQEHVIFNQQHSRLEKRVSVLEQKVR